VTLSVVGNFQGVVDDAGSLSLAGATLAGGPLSVTAAGGLQLLAAANVNTGNGTTTLEATGGSLTMATGSQINAGQGSVTLSASNSVALSTVNSLTLVVVSARGGAISGGATTAITAPSVALQAASGIGSAQPLSTATALLAATTGLGNLQIDNSGTLDIGNVSGVAGLTTTGGGSIALVNVGSISVSAPVTSAGGGSILINADATAGTSNLTISGPIAALGGGSINLIADRSLTILDSGQINDISVQGTGQIIASAQSYTIGPNVLLTSGTGAISEVPVSLTNVSSPQISSLGDSSITGNIGQAGDRNLTVTVDWADGAVTSTPVAAAGAFDVAHEYIGDPNKGNAQDPVSATVTVTSDPNIVFTGVNPVSAVVQAAIPGTGLTVFVTQLTQTVVLTTVMIIRLEEPVQLAAPVAAAEPAPIVVPPATQEKTTDERQVVLSVITATGDEKSVVRLPVGVLDDLPSLFQKLPDGHYRVYLNEPGAKHLRRVIDVQLRQGRPVAPRDESDTGESMSGTSRLEDTAPGRLVKGPASDESRGQSSALREDSPQAEIAVPHAPLADQPAPSAGPWQALLGGLGFLVGGASAGEFGSAGRLGRRLASGGKNPFGRGARAARKAKRSSDRSSPDR
jgi:hypothetical protein